MKRDRHFQRACFRCSIGWNGNPKALERLFELLQESYLSLTSESDLKAYLTQMRIRNRPNYQRRSS